MADKEIKTDNELLKSMAKKVGNTIVGTHTDNYYLKKIEAKIGGGGGEAYDDTDLKEKMGYDSIPAGESLQGQIGELQTAVGDLDDGLDDKADVGHTHTESDITDLGDYIAKSNIDGLVKNDGTIDEHTYSQSGHTHLMADITDLSLPAAVKVVTTLPSASADTMDKLFILVGNDTVDVYYTTKSGNTYSWNKMDDDILDNLSIEWSDIQDRPTDVADFTDNHNTAFTPKSHNHVMNDITDLDIPSDVSDLTDTNNTQFTPKSHTHTESDITDLGDYIEKSNTAGLLKNDGTIDTNSYSQSGHTHLMNDITDLDIPSDVSELTDTQNTPFTPKSHSHTISDLPTANSITDGDTTHIASVDVIYDYIDEIIGDADDWLTS